MKYTFIDARDLEYVYKRGFVYKDKNGKLQRKSYYDIKDYYENLEGKYTKAQIYYMIKQADVDCDRYIELHKNDIEVGEWKPRKYKDMNKEEFINYLINSGYSDIDAKEKADAWYGEE